ncbi:MAG: hypothetical protein PVI92_14050 [Chromatiales bacterium]
MFSGVFRRVLSAMLLVALGSLQLHAEENPNLSASLQVAHKVEAETRLTLNKTGEPVSAPEGDLGPQAFAEGLKTRYKGSHTFLKNRNRENGSLEYREGALSDEIQKGAWIVFSISNAG